MDEGTEVQGHRRWVGTTSEGEAAIGRIAIWAAAVEDNLVHLCAFLINSTDADVGHAVTENMSASATIQLAKKLVTDSKRVSAQDAAELLEMLTEAKAALEQRNRILHATVGEIMIEGKTVFFNRRRMRQGDAATLHGVEELDEIGARLFRVSEDLWGCLNN